MLRSIITGLRNPYMNIRINTSRKHHTRILERPGKWMTEDEQKELVEGLRHVVAQLGIGGLEYGIASGRKEVLDNCILTIIYDSKTRKPFAFNALTYMDCTLKGRTETVVHLGLVVIDPNYRAKGLSWILYGLTTFLLFLKNRFKPLWVSNVTQVPAIVGMVAEGFGNVYPDPIRKSRRTFTHLSLAREIMTKHRQVFGVGHDAEFDEERFVIRNAYTGGSDNLKKTFESAPKHRREGFNSFCQSELDYERGDDIIQLGVMDVGTYYRYMIHSVPAKSKLVLLYKVLFYFFESSLVPIVQWFSVTKQVGPLRPRKRAWL